jgi:hypothetical protein
MARVLHISKKINRAMFYVLLFVLLVTVIAIVTHKINTKVPCDHDWHEHDDKVKCSKCSKSIPNYNTSASNTYSKAA